MNYQLNDELRIVPFTREHFEGAAYRSWWHDVDVTRFNSHGLFPYTQKQLDAFMRVIEDGSTEQIVWAIEWYTERMSVLTGKPYAEWHHIGNVSLQRINMVYRSAELAIIIGDKGAWGKGVATLACKAVIAHGFKRLNLHRIWTGTAATNVGMQKVATKCGMQHEGTLRNAMFLDGGYVNIEQYAVLHFADCKIEVRTETSPPDGSYWWFTGGQCDGMGEG